MLENRHYSGLRFQQIQSSAVLLLRSCGRMTRLPPGPLKPLGSHWEPLGATESY